jgi:hypothetical protein
MCRVKQKIKHAFCSRIYETRIEELNTSRQRSEQRRLSGGACCSRAIKQEILVRIEPEPWSMVTNVFILPEGEPVNGFLTRAIERLRETRKIARVDVFCEA